MRSSFIVLATAAALGAMPSCATLPTLDVCGNGLVDNGEDCDGAATVAGATCGAPNTPHACRFLCDVKGSKKEACPAKYFCSGVDGVCRATSGSYAPKKSIQFNADHLGVADFDGDGIADLFASRGSGSSLEDNVYFFGAGGTVSQPTRLPPIEFAAGGLLTGKSGAELVGFLSTSSVEGMLVLQGTSTRSLLPASFSSFPLHAPLTFLPYETALNTQILTLLGSDINGLTLGSRPVNAARLKSPPHLDLGRAGYLGDAASGTECLGIANTHDVDVYTYVNAGSTLKRIMTVTPSDASVNVEDYWFTFYDDDPYLDLVMLTDCGPGKAACDRLYVAYGGTSGFAMASSPTAIPSSNPTAMSVPYLGGSGHILGVANLTGGSSGDVIAVDRINSESMGLVFFNNSPFTNVPTEVVTADFNRDGLTDVVLAIKGSPELDLLLNAGGGLFNLSTLALAGEASHLAVGDFDGDLYPDVAFAETIDTDTAKVGFAFGGPGATLDGLLEVGPFSPISQVVARPNIASQSPSSERADLLVVTGTKKTGSHIAVFPGSADRKLFSPWLFVTEGKNGSIPGTPTSAAIGSFSGVGTIALAALVNVRTLGEVFYTGSLSLLEASNGTLTPPTTTLALPSGVQSTATALVTIPGSQGAPDHLAVVALTPSGSSGEIAVARAKGGAFEFDGSPLELPIPPVMADASYSAFGFQPLSSFITTPRVPSCAADLDGDGATDLALIGQGKHGSSLVVAWGDHEHLTKPVEVSLGKKISPTWIACIVTSSGVEIATLTGDGVRLTQCDAKRSCIAGNVVAPTAIAINGMIPVPQTGFGTGTLMGTSSGGSSYGEPPVVVVGDVTGDGLDDILVTGVSGDIQIFTAKPTIP